MAYDWPEHPETGNVEGNGGCEAERARAEGQHVTPEIHGGVNRGLNCQDIGGVAVAGGVGAPASPVKHPPGILFRVEV